MPLDFEHDFGEERAPNRDSGRPRSQNRAGDLPLGAVLQGDRTTLKTLDSPPASGVIPFLITLADATTTTKSVVLSLAGGPVVRFRLFAESFSGPGGLPDYTWSVNNETLHVQTPVSTTQAAQTEWWPLNGGTVGPVLVDLQYQTVPLVPLVPDDANLANLYSPIRYVRGGWEPPGSYLGKVLSNGTMKNVLAPGRGGLFPFTEMDLPGTQNKRVNDLGDFIDGSAPVYPSTLPAATTYPFAYGIHLATKDGLFLSSQSPFFVEKLAGVDSQGLLWGALSDLRSRFDQWTPGFEQRMAARTSDPLPSVPDYLAQLKTVVQAALKKQTEFSSQWYLSNSRVVTRLSDARPGDILLGQEGSEWSIAVVEAIVGDTSTWEKAKTAIRVVTVNRALDAAVYSTWGAFTAHPEQYHLRRLLVAQGAGNVVATRFSKPSDPSATYTLTRNDGWVNWIPNTQELHWLGQIKLSGSWFKDGQSWSLDANTGAEDFGFSDGTEAQGNIFRNSAAGTKFTVYALPAPHRENGVTFHRTSEIKVFEITRVAGSQHLHVTTFPEGDSGLYQLIVRNGNLAVEKTDQAGQANLYFDQWGMVAETAAGAPPVPGDDLTLRFTVDGTQVPGVVPRLAVYDKKLLWRANLYVDEGGPSDWNNLHPWATGNEWNKVYDGTQNVPFSQLVPGNGGQVVKLPDFTPLRTLSGSIDVPGAANKLNGTVAYSFPSHPNEATNSVSGATLGDSGSMDSPFDFVWKMRKQQIAMQASIIQLGPFVRAVIPSDGQK